jgi:protein-S-isoprenylcysteine O-methyltransferase Ste14
MVLFRLISKPLLIFIAAVAVRHVVQLIITRNIRKSGEKTDFIDTLGLFITYVLVMVMTVISLLFRKHFDLSYLLGFIVMEFSVLMRFSALRTLGEFFSYEIRIAEDHKLINTGVYSLVRHPLHLAFLGEVLGMAIISRSPYAFIVTLALALIITRRNRIEDEALRSKFGEEFDRYAEKVPSMNIFKGIRNKQVKVSSNGEPQKIAEEQEKPE